MLFQPLILYRTLGKISSTTMISLVLKKLCPLTVTSFATKDSAHVRSQTHMKVFSLIENLKGEGRDEKSF